MSPTSYQLLYSAILSFQIGAENRGRTGTVLPPGDFKSPASAYSAIPAIERQIEFKGGAISSAFDIGSGGRARTDSLPVNSRLLRH